MCIDAVKKTNADVGADDFYPVFLFTVIHSQLPYMASNVTFIEKFRNPFALSGGEGYSLANARSALTYIESLDVTKLSNITEEEYNTNVKIFKEVVRKEELQITSSNGLFSSKDDDQE